MSGKGLYANIHAKRARIAAGSGEKMRKPGTKGAPTSKAFKASAKTAKKPPVKKLAKGSTKIPLEPMPYTNPEFQKRIDNPERSPVLRNKSGQMETHRMAAERGEDGKWYVFPTVQNIDGKLKKFSSVPRAFRSALQRGDYYRFNTKEEAVPYASGAYKTPKFRRYYDELSRKK